MKSNFTDNIIWKLINDPFFDGLNQIDRWQGHKTIKKESVAQHSFAVVLFSRVLAEQIFPEDDYKSKLQVTECATFHDFDEVISGDLSHGLKYNETNGAQIRELLEKYIDIELSKKFNVGLKEEKMIVDSICNRYKPYIKAIVKVADWLSMVSYLLGERATGNHSITKEYRYCVKSVRKSAIKAIEFLELFYDGDFDQNILLMLKNHDIV